jgi:hypothetical protein
MGLRAMYEQYQPEGIGRDTFIALGRSLGLMLEPKRNQVRTTFSVNGHGKKHLASTLAAMMFLAFLVDQVQAAADVLFARVSEALSSKMKFWEALRAVFKLKRLSSMTAAITTIGVMYAVLKQ